MVAGNSLGGRPVPVRVVDVEYDCMETAVVSSDLMLRVTDVFRDVFEDDGLEITRQTNAADVSGWDSLMHVRLMLAIEKAFGVRFASSEVASMQQVGDLLDALGKKTGDPGVV
jgi:acyl carrier protein